MGYTDTKKLIVAFRSFAKMPKEQKWDIVYRKKIHFVQNFIENFKFFQSLLSGGNKHGIVDGLKRYCF